MAVLEPGICAGLDVAAAPGYDARLDSNTRLRMGYKYKPSKGVLKRVRVTSSGKIKHNHELTSHRRSARPAWKKRKLGRASILFEGHARNLRYFLGLSGLKPNKAAHERALAEKPDQTATA